MIRYLEEKFKKIAAIVLVASLITGCAGKSGKQSVLPSSNITNDETAENQDYSVINEHDVIFSTFNTSDVSNKPTEGTTFTVAEGSTFDIWSITTYHWNNGQGAKPGQIKLLRGGSVIGSWDTKGRSGNGKQDVYWDMTTHITIPEGEYEIVDSDPDTWSCNSESGNKGFVEIRGYEMFESSEGYDGM